MAVTPPDADFPLKLEGSGGESLHAAGACAQRSISQNSVPHIAMLATMDGKIHQPDGSASSRNSSLDMT